MAEGFKNDGAIFEPKIKAWTMNGLNRVENAIVLDSIKIPQANGFLARERIGSTESS